MHAHHRYLSFRFSYAPLSDVVITEYTVLPKASYTMPKSYLLLSHPWRRSPARRQRGTGPCRCCHIAVRANFPDTRAGQALTPLLRAIIRRLSSRRRGVAQKVKQAELGACYTTASLRKMSGKPPSFPFNRMSGTFLTPSNHDYTQKSPPCPRWPARRTSRSAPDCYSRAPNGPGPRRNIAAMLVPYAGPFARLQCRNVTMRTWDDHFRRLWISRRTLMAKCFVFYEALQFAS